MARKSTRGSKDNDALHTRSYYQRNREAILIRTRERYLQNCARIKQHERNRFLAKNFGLPAGRRRRVWPRQKATKSPVFRTEEGRRAAARRRVARHRERHRAETDTIRIRRLQDLGGRCACCGLGIEFWWCLQEDHIMPIARGGTHDRANLQVLCSGCNSSKSGGLHCSIPHRLLVPEDKR